MVRLMNVCSVAAGMTKLDPMDRSMVTPCLVNNVEYWEKTTANTKQLAQMGNSLRTAFASSTSPGLQIFPTSFDPSGETKALLRNLWQPQDYNYVHDM